MSKHAYIPSIQDDDLWVKDGNFKLLTEKDSPFHYEYFGSLKKAKNLLQEEGIYDGVVYKFESKPPYKFVGKFS